MYGRRQSQWWLVYELLKVNRGVCVEVGVAPSLALADAFHVHDASDFRNLGTPKKLVQARLFNGELQNNIVSRKCLSTRARGR